MKLDVLLRHIDRGLTTYAAATGTAHTATGETCPAGTIEDAFAGGLIRLAGAAGGQYQWLGLTDAGLGAVHRMDEAAA